MAEATEIGVCLNDKALVPFIDELLEDRNTDLKSIPVDGYASAGIESMIKVPPPDHLTFSRFSLHQIPRNRSTILYLPSGILMIMS